MPESRSSGDGAARPRPPLTLRGRMLSILAIAGIPGLLVAVYLTVEKLRDETAQLETAATRLAAVAASEQGTVLANARTLLKAVAEFQTPVDGGDLDCRSYVESWADELAYVTSLTLYDGRGNAVCRGEDGVLPQTAANRAWFDEVLASGSPALSDYALGTDGQPLLIAAHPIAYAGADAEGAGQGVVALGISLEWLSLLAASLDLPDAATITTLGPNNGVLSHWDENPDGTDGRPLPSEAALEAIAGQGSGVVRAEDAGGKARVYGLAEAEAGGLTLVVGLPPYVRYANWAEAFFETLIAPLAVLALALLAAAWASEALVVRHVRALIGTADALKAGALEARTDVAYNEHEMGQLAAALDAMADAMERNHTELAERSEMDKTIAREMQHRIGNTLALARAIASQTLKRSESNEAFLKTYGQRLSALAVSNQMLIENDWVSTPLGALVDAVLAPHLDAGSPRPRLEGPEIEIGPRACLALALTLHELATNAVKYGALATDGGRLSVEWSLEPRGPGTSVLLVWRETGSGRPAASSGEGFGTQLMSMMVERSLDGTITPQPTPEGMTYTITFPLASAAPAKPVQERERPA